MGAREYPTLVSICKARRHAAGRGVPRRWKWRPRARAADTPSLPCEAASPQCHRWVPNEQRSGKYTGYLLIGRIRISLECRGRLVFLGLAQHSRERRRLLRPRRCGHRRRCFGLSRLSGFSGFSRLSGFSGLSGLSGLRLGHLAPLAAARAAGLMGVRHLVHNIFQKVEGLIRLCCALPIVSAFTYKWYGATRFPPLLRVCSTEQATMSCMNNSSALATLVVRTYK